MHDPRHPYFPLTGEGLMHALLAPLHVDAPTGLAVIVPNEGACDLCVENAEDNPVVSAFINLEELNHPNCQCNLEPYEPEPGDIGPLEVLF